MASFREVEEAWRDHVSQVNQADQVVLEFHSHRRRVAVVSVVVGLRVGLDKADSLFGIHRRGWHLQVMMSWEENYDRFQ